MGERCFSGVAHHLTCVNHDVQHDLVKQVMLCDEQIQVVKTGARRVACTRASAPREMSHK